MLQRLQRPTAKFVNVFHGVVTGVCTMKRRELDGTYKFRLETPGLKPKWVVSIDGELYDTRRLAEKGRESLRQAATLEALRTPEYRAHQANPEDKTLEVAAYNASKAIARRYGLRSVWK